MLANWKRKREEKRAVDKAVAESQYWKTHPGLQSCLQSMRGSCTVAPQQMHEAAIAVVNIALMEDTWTQSEQIPEDFLADTLYIVWNDEKIPVLKAPRDLVLEYFSTVTAVSEKTFLVSDTMDRIVHWTDGNFYLYSVS